MCYRASSGNPDQGTGVAVGMVPEVGIVAMRLGIAVGVFAWVGPADWEAGQLLSFTGTCTQFEPLVQTLKLIVAPTAPKQSTTCWPFSVSIALQAVWPLGVTGEPSALTMLNVTVCGSSTTACGI